MSDTETRRWRPGTKKVPVLARRTNRALRYTESEREKLMVRIKSRLQGKLQAHRQMRSLDASAGNEQGVRSAVLEYSRSASAAMQETAVFAPEQIFVGWMPHAAAGARNGSQRLEVGAVALLRGQGRRSKHHSDADTCAVLPANKLSNSGADKARVDEKMDGVDATTDISDTIVMHAERGEEAAAIQTQEYGSRAVRRRTPRGPAD